VYKFPVIRDNGGMASLVWGLLALALGGALVFSAQLEFLVPAAAAVVLMACALIPGFSESYLAQALVWLALSAGGLVLFRNRLRQLKFGFRRGVEDSVAGRRALVVEAIGETGGRVRFQGTTWKAVSAEPVAAGVEVVILGQDGLVFQVERPETDRVEEELRALETRKEN
jgi:membrane protein implicated in regulation of membrane protease activity